MERDGEGRDVYFCTHLLTGPRRIKVNAASLFSLWGEVDSAELPNGSRAPSSIVESSPGHYHLSWRLTKPVDPQVVQVFPVVYMRAA